MVSKLPPNYRWFDDWVAGAAMPLPDELGGLQAEGIVGLVRLEIEARSKVTPQQVADAGMVDLHEPIRPEIYVPTVEQAERIVGWIRGMVAEGRKVVVTCGVGAGRTGTIVACYFIENGLDGEAAIQRVNCLQEPAQERFVRAYAAAKGRGP